MGNCTVAPPTNHLVERRQQRAVVLERIGPAAILRLALPGFHTSLSRQQKQLAYMLAQATLAGRDMLYVGPSPLLRVRCTLEEVMRAYEGDRTSAVFLEGFEPYLKLLWLTNSLPPPPPSSETVFTLDYLGELLEGTPSLRANADRLRKKLGTAMFSNNSTVKEEKEEGALLQHGGAALVECCKWLNKACELADTPQQRRSIELLVQYYETGDECYNQAAVSRGGAEAVVDFVHSVSSSSGCYASMVVYKDVALTAKYAVLAEEASWFEAQSPTMDEHKRLPGKGDNSNTFIVVNAVVVLPQLLPLSSSSWYVRNVEEAVFAAKLQLLSPLVLLPSQHALLRRYGAQAHELCCALRQLVGRGSGRMRDGVAADEEEAMRVVERARIELVALYFVADEHLANLGVLCHTDDNDNESVVQAAYVHFMIDALWLSDDDGGRRVVARWVLERAQKQQPPAVSLLLQQEHYYCDVADCSAMRDMFGELLREVQRIKSENDVSAARALVERYGGEMTVASSSSLPLQWGVLNAELELVAHEAEDDEEDDEEVHHDVILSSNNNDTSFSQQMMMYSERYSYL